MENGTKIALITGGNRGLGKNAALRLAQQGVDVIITYRSHPEEAEGVVTTLTALGRNAAALQLDVSEVQSFDLFTQTLSELLQSKWNRTQFDYLVNNAGIDVYGQIGQVTESAFDNLFNVHFKGAYFLTQALLPLLADGGRIINLSTGLARFAIPGYSAYAAMKSAMETFTKYLAKELGSRSITANIVAPGIIATDFNLHAREANPQIEPYLASQTALGRIGQPDDIGGVIAFLCSEDARWINAQRIEASGGMFL